MKRLLIVVLVIAGLFGMGIGVMVLTLQSNMKTIRAIPIEQLDLENVDDGVYTGSYYFEDQIGATLEVHVLNHQITDIIVVEHKAGKGELAESLLEDIIVYQTIDVDDVAGVTTSSHVLKLAVENAFEEEE